MKVKTTLNIVAEIEEKKYVLPMEVWLFTQEEFNTLDYVELERLQLTYPIVSLVNGEDFRYELAPFIPTSNLLINRHRKLIMSLKLIRWITTSNRIRFLLLKSPFPLKWKRINFCSLSMPFKSLKPDYRTFHKSYDFLSKKCILSLI